MRASTRLELALGAACAALLLCAPASAAETAPARLRVFFSGHSLIDNPMPDWVESIAQSRGQSLGWQEQIVLGSPIRVRTRGNDPEASSFSGYQLGKSKSGGKIDVLRELANPTELRPGEKYDRLVITERTDLLGAMRWEDTAGYLEDFHGRLAASSPTAETRLTEVWPEIDDKNPAAWLAYVEGEYFAWQCVAARVNQRLAAKGRPGRVSLVPAGLALRELLQRALDGSVPGITGTPRERVHAVFTDDVHLTPLGIYLNAAVHYAALFGKTPVGAAGAPGVNPDALALLQQIAWDTSARAAAEPLPALTECRTRFASERCPAYNRYRGKPENDNQCKGWAAPDSPLSERSSSPRRTLPALIGWGSGAAGLVVAGLVYLWKRRRPSSGRLDR